VISLSRSIQFRLHTKQHSIGILFSKITFSTSWGINTPWPGRIGESIDRITVKIGEFQQMCSSFTVATGMRLEEDEELEMILSRGKPRGHTGNTLAPMMGYGFNTRLS